MTSLSGRLLLLTVAFVMLAEVFIYVPSISRFRKQFLEEQVIRAHLAALALDAAPEMRVGKDLERRLLDQVGAHGIVLRNGVRRMLVLSRDLPPEATLAVDLGAMDALMWIEDAFATMTRSGPTVMRVMGTVPGHPGVTIEIVTDESALRAGMYDYSVRILQLSVIISLVTAGLVYLSLHRLMVRPMRRITRSMVAFRVDPEDETTTPPHTSRSDEIGVAQRELVAMQEDLRAALRQRTRLATLGAAVARINHDLRNSLTTAVLVSDRLADLDDPEVRKVTPRLYEAIHRAVALCGQTLAYAGNSQPPLQSEIFPLRDLIDEVGHALKDEPRPNSESIFRWRNEVEPETQVDGDRIQLFRAIHNIALNARQAGARTVTVKTRRNALRASLSIQVTDDGPGLPARAQETLFQPFAASGRQGGSGLGLAIARDILHAHGGSVDLLGTGPAGTTFLVTLPMLPEVP